VIEGETISVEFQNVDDEYVQIFAFDSRDYFINWFKKIEALCQEWGWKKFGNLKRF